MVSIASTHKKKIAALMFAVLYLNLIAGAHFQNNVAFTNHYSVYNVTRNIINRGAEKKAPPPIQLAQKAFKKEKQLIGGPGQPEMKSFQSVNASNMVDLFTGDFSYNIPLLDVGGYPVNIHYSSGITMDQEATWVGLGWNVNPGAINRNMRGLPDDFDGTDSLIKTKSIRTNKTVGVDVGVNTEVGGANLNANFSLGVFHNTYQGFGLEYSAGLSASTGSGFGDLTGNLTIRNNSQTGLTVNPSLHVRLTEHDQVNNLRGSLGISTGYSTRSGLSALQFDGGFNAYSVQGNSKGQYSEFNFPVAAISFAVPAYTPSITMPLTDAKYSFVAKVGGEAAFVHPNGMVTGYVSKQFIANEDTTQKLPAIGILYASKSVGRDNVVLDYNREKELQFNYTTTPHIAIPQYTYDVFNISGEGIGGSFRAYRGDVGYAFDHQVSSKSKSESGSIDVGFGALFHAGVEFNDVTSSTQNHKWKTGNNIEPLLRFTDSDSLYESVYFRNPGEKTTNSMAYLNTVGQNDLIRIGLSGNHDNVQTSASFISYKDGQRSTETSLNSPIIKNERAKRTQVISWLNAKDAAVLALDTVIISYNENQYPSQYCDGFKSIRRVDQSVHKANHISEIKVLNTDGKKYVYGIPIYNVSQKDVTFSIGKENDGNNIANGLVNYTPGIDNSAINNHQGKENYFSKDEIPAYASAFLLTGILSPDYVDVTGNGISEDDQGDAVKFNYSQVYGANDDYYAWRSPAPVLQNKANYNEGLKTYSRDDKAGYSYGKKELWYLNSVESKSMIAVFRISSRNDGYSSIDENGGLNISKGLRKLDRIDLYAKADYFKNGTNAKAIKTVHFAYSYKLCKGFSADPNTGKLTLDSLWFTYNGNENGKRHPYAFNYHPDPANPTSVLNNPSYNAKEYDRWGSYKDPSNNPGSLSNVDYPYTTQDSTIAAQNAQAWTLTNIGLPSGSKMKVTYEADDYAFVQNKRAAIMTSISGINTSGGNTLYASGNTGFNRIYILTNDIIASKADIANKYLDVTQALYYKIAVKMPDDRWGSGYEFVPGYARIADYGIAANNNKQFWIDLSTPNNESPLIHSALQFLRLNLPSKAYPSSELGDDIDLKDAITALVSSFHEINNAINGFDNVARGKNWCKYIDLSKSFVRLNAPGFKKYGGGLRVKRIEVSDNWNAMTGQKESVYGQEYNYTTSEEVAGQKIIISSGVATYEPPIGNEENPWHKPIEYNEQLAPLAPVNALFSEEPVGESFFQSPVVGYSKVRIRTINAKARSANGWEETEFYTSRDFPTLTDYTILDDESKKKYETNVNPLRFKHTSHVTISQGFRVELNDMNGKLKKQSTYAENDSVNPFKYVKNYYKTDNENAVSKHLNNTVAVADSANGNVNMSAEIGKDIELITDFREQHSTSHTMGVSPNIDLATFGPFPIPLISLFKIPQSEDIRFRSAAVVKVIQRYGILDSVVVMDKGSIVSTKNMVYDAETGNVLLSRTNNEFNDPVYNFNYPAYWAYTGMGPAYKNLDAILSANSGANSGYKLISGKLYNENDTAAYPVEKIFESGDEIYVDIAWNAIPNLSPDCRMLQSTGKSYQGKLWVIDAGKTNGGKGLYFIDAFGKPATLIINRMHIIRSGKRNLIDASVGAVTMLTNPLIQQPSGSYKITIDNNSKVLNTNAATFTDLWKVKQGIHQEDSCYTYQKTDIGFLPPPDIQLVAVSNYASNDKATYMIPGYKDAVASFEYTRSRLFASSSSHKTKSLFKFNFSQIPLNAKINFADLSLPGSSPIGLWNVGDEVSDHHYINWNDNSLPTALMHPDDLLSFVSLTTDWNSSTKYYDFKEDKIVKVSGLYTAPSSISVHLGNLVSDMIQKGESDIMMRLDNETDKGDNTSQARYASFKGGSGPCAEAKLCYLDRPSLYISYTYFRDTCVKVCHLDIDTNNTNPYRFGILGNWRSDKAITYYNSRTESDAGSAITNIRNEGTIANFSPYWNFTSSTLNPSEDPTRWVWNSKISTINKKGFEIENHDPLGRYNSGLYGYNQSMPIAVAQNAKYREIISDGFEDYSYLTSYCINCRPGRDIDFVGNNNGVVVSKDQSHTGLYSLLINSGSDAKLSFPITPLGIDTSGATLGMAIDSTAITGPVVTGTGNGLTGEYYPSAFIGTRDDINCQIKSTPDLTRVDPNLYFDWGSPPVSCDCADAYQVNWNGKIQFEYTTPYTLFFLFNGSAQIAIYDDDNNIIGGGRWFNSPGIEQSFDIAYGTFEPGKLYNISISYLKTEADQDGQVMLSWQAYLRKAKEIIPQNFLYTADQTGTVSGPPPPIKYYCIKANPVKPTQVFAPVFSPVAGSTVVVSAWAKLKDNTLPVPDSVINLGFSNSTAHVWLSKTGVPIEGWQRYEGNIKMFTGANSLVIDCKEKNNQSIYIDDIRVHPFNANMKSYVYNPENLRLMADLDENNYATFYEYDDDGTLIRVKKETERGIMTIKETRSALIKNY